MRYDDGCDFLDAWKTWNAAMLEQDKKWKDGDLSRFYAESHMPCLASTADAGTGALRDFLLKGRNPSLAGYPRGSWHLALKIKLTQPLYTADGEPMLLDHNVTLAEKALRTPCVPGASVRGNLRMATRATRGYWAEADDTARQNSELFGPWTDQMDEGDIHVGRLHFYPLYFHGEIDWKHEVITPLDAHTRFPPKGPIRYAVVPTGAEGSLELLYLADPDAPEMTVLHLGMVRDGLREMLYTYGFSAKRKLGWGTADIVPGGRLTMQGLPASHTPIDDKAGLGTAMQAAIESLGVASE